MMSGDSKLLVEGLTKEYGDTVAVNDISFTASTGHLTSLLGPSGCGKTTTLRCIAGLERPTEGQIYLDGELVTDGDEIVVPPDERDLGMVFQSYAIWPHMDVESNVGYGLKLRGMGKEERKERVAEVLEMVGLGGLQDNNPSELSGGQQQRVVLARSLAYEPELMLLDEPLANLDAKLRRQMQREIKNIQEKTGLTSVYVTHDQEEGMVLSDQMMVMNDGDIIERGAPEVLFNQPETEWTAQFLGKSNMLSVQVERRNGSSEVVTEFGSYSTTEDISEPDPSLFIRPNNIRIGTGDDTAFDGEGIEFEGTIKERNFLGEFTEYTVGLPDSSTELQVASTARVLDMAEGDRVRCFLPADYCTLL